MIVVGIFFVFFFASFDCPYFIPVFDFGEEDKRKVPQVRLIFKKLTDIQLERR